MPMLLRQLLRIPMDGTPGAAGGGGAAGGQGAGASGEQGGGAGSGGAAGQGDGKASGQGEQGAQGDAGKGGAAGGQAGGEGDKGGGKEPPAAKWPENWREDMAGGDEKTLKLLQRYNSPKDLPHAIRSFQQRLSSGELKSQLPKDAKPEEVTKWREENGIPAKPEDYKMPEGLTIGEADKPLIDTFLKSMHAKNASPDLVQEAIKSYYSIQEQQIAQLAEADVSHKQEMEDTLRSEWGGEYRGNVNAIKAMLETAPGGIADKILSARMGDGRAIANDPDVLKWLAQTARELNPVATVVPAGGDQMGAIESEINALKSKMGDRNSDYWKGPKADKLQARYRELISARDKRK